MTYRPHTHELALWTSCGSLLVQWSYHADDEQLAKDHAEHCLAHQPAAKYVRWRRLGSEEWKESED